MVKNSKFEYTKKLISKKVVKLCATILVTKTTITTFNEKLCKKLKLHTRETFRVKIVSEFLKYIILSIKLNKWFPC